MHKRSLLVLLASLALIGLVAVGISWGTTGDSRFDSALPSYTGGHASAATVSEAVCETCHTEEAGSYNNVHWRHRASIYLGFHDSYDGTTTSPLNGCGRCHSQGVAPNGSGTLNESAYGGGYEGNLSYTDTGDTSIIRKQVSPEICRRCHGKFVTSPQLNPAGHNGVTVVSNCTNGCHNGVNGRTAATAHTGVNWINHAISDNVSGQACTICHGADGTGAVTTNRVWFQEQERNPIPAGTWP